MSSTSFCERAVELLSMGSPFFDELWPLIFELSDRETQDALHLTHRYFKSMWERADVQHKSESAQAEYRIVITDRMYPKEYQLEFPSPSPPSSSLANAAASPSTFPNVPWYAFGAYKSGFGRPQGFFDFCDLADVDPDSGVRVDEDDDDEGFVWLSRTRDFTFTTQLHPLAPGGWSGYVHLFSCTGEREKVLKLENWWINNGDASTISRGKRHLDYLGRTPF